MNLFKNTRFYVLVFSVVFSIGVFLYVKTTIPNGGLQIIRLTQIYALTSVTFLYLTLIITPLTRFFTFLPYRGEMVKMRRAVGVSAFYFAVLHASLAFFGQLGGFAGLFYLTSNYLWAVGLGASALFILTLMTLTAFDTMIDRLGFTRWKLLHRLIYVVAIFVLIHALMLGTHFQDLSQAIPQIFFIAFAFLIILEAKRLDEYIENRFNFIHRFGLVMLVVISFVATLSVLFLLPISNGNVSLGIHAQHIEIAKEAQKTQTIPANLPGMDGDKTKRYTVSFNQPENIAPETETELEFQVYDASSGNKVLLFQKIYDQMMHLVVVDNELVFYNHIHPEQTVDGFKIKTSFPHSGRYHLYLNFQPVGAIEQQFAFIVNVGDFETEARATQKPDTNLTKDFEKYQVKVAYPNPLRASELSIGNQQITFTVNDLNGNPVTNLKPYLEAFGHLVMINTATYDYLHVHPVNLVPSNSTQTSGPTVDFLPLGFYGPIKPGTYRLFAQFNPNDELFISDFTVEIK